MARALLRAALAAAAISVTSASAAPSACPQHFAGGQAPDLLKPQLSNRSAEVCYTAYALLHSGLTRTGLWSAERVTAASAAAGRAQDRTDDFHPEPSVAAADRAELRDYVRSGFDRGHLSPSADMPDPRAQSESFSLGNMVPQDPDTNRGQWARVESAVRDLATSYGEVYVVTGPAFTAPKLRALNGRVAVPTHVWKAVFIPSVGMAGAYVAGNDPAEPVRLASVAEVSALSGIDPFPALAAAAKASAVALPMPGAPKPRKASSGAGGGQPASAAGEWMSWARKRAGW